MIDFESMTLEEIRETIETGMEALVQRLKEQGFGDEINIGGIMHNGYNNVVLTDVYDMYKGDVNYNHQTFRLM